MAAPLDNVLCMVYELDLMKEWLPGMKRSIKQPCTKWVHTRVRVCAVWSPQRACPTTGSARSVRWCSGCRGPLQTGASPPRCGAPPFTSRCVCPACREATVWGYGGVLGERVIIFFRDATPDDLRKCTGKLLPVLGSETVPS